MKTRQYALAPLIILAFGLSGLAAGPPREVASSAQEISPLLPGLKAPDVTFRQLDGSPLSLSAAVSEKKTVLIFYRGGW